MSSYASHISLFSSLRVMPRVPTILHLLVAHDDDSTRYLANCDENYKFDAYPYSTLQEFAVDNTLIVTSHPKTARKLHAWRKGSNKLDIS